MNILISGGSGFIGSALTKSLTQDGHKVWILSRSPAMAKTWNGVQALGWDGYSSQGWLEVFEGMDAVVNLAGETVGRWPWNAARKGAILGSRLRAGQAMTDAFERARRKPPVLIQASGIGYYGALGTQRVDESAPVGSDFMAGVASAWESSSFGVEAISSVRRVVIRTALVLDSREGVLPLMALPIRLFAGGPLGAGQQGVSWIHIQDEVRAIRFLMENARANGAFNLTAPVPVSNTDFMRSLAAQLGRPYWLPAPAFALKLALGEMSTLLLDGQYAIPQRLLDLGFQFEFEKASDALGALY